jgi:hypothetical protein
MLALIGTVSAVPALTDLLQREETADLARYALDAIDDEAVDEVYRDALPRLRGAAKAGLIGSIAARADTRALPHLRALADDPAEPSDVRVAAARAVERLTANERSATDEDRR